MCCNRVFAASGNVSIPPGGNAPLGGVERTRLSRMAEADVVVALPARSMPVADRSSRCEIRSAEFGGQPGLGADAGR